MRFQECDKIIVVQVRILCLSVLCVTCWASTGSGRNPNWRMSISDYPAIADLVLDFEINNEPFQANLGEAVASFQLVSAESLELAFGIHRTPWWFHTGTTDFATDAGGAEVDIRFYSVHGWPHPRIATDITLAFNSDTMSERDFNRINMITQGTMAAENVLLDSRHRLIRGLSGPSVPIDVVMFDNIVGGQPFLIRATRLSFVDWRPSELGLVFITAPEPATVVHFFTYFAALWCCRRFRACGLR